MQNTGESVFEGIDLSFVYQPVTFINIYAAYSFIQRKNISNPDILFTDVPDHKVFGSVEYDISNKMMVNFFAEYNSERVNASDGTRISPGYSVFNLQVAYRFLQNFTAEAGVNNILDRNYTIQEGYPETGRNFYIALSFSLQRKSE